MELALFILLVAGMSWIYKKLFVPCPEDGSRKRIGLGGWAVVLAATVLLVGVLEQAQEEKGVHFEALKIRHELERVEQRLGELDNLAVRYDAERKLLETRLEVAQREGTSLEQARRDPRLGDTALRLAHLDEWIGRIEDRREKLRSRWLELDRAHFQARHLHEMGGALGRLRPEFHRTGSPLLDGTSESRRETYGSLERDARRHRHQ